MDVNDVAFARWSSATMDTAIRRAIDMARNRWWETRIDDTQTYSYSTFSYALPPACERIVDVYFEPTDSYSPQKICLPKFWRMDAGSLYFTESFPEYDGNTLYIYYQVPAGQLLNVTAADGVIATNTLTSATATFITNGVKEGDSVELYKSAYAGNGTYYVVSVTSETVLVMNESPGTGSSVTYYVARYTDVPEQYILNAAKGWLYEWVANNKPGREIQDNLQRAAYYKQVAEMELNNMLRPGRQGTRTVQMGTNG
jgi:hypothetical protein